MVDKLWYIQYTLYIWWANLWWVTIVIPQFLVDISKLLEGVKMKGDILWDFMWFNQNQELDFNRLGWKVQFSTTDSNPIQTSTELWQICWGIFQHQFLVAQGMMHNPSHLRIFPRIPWDPGAMLTIFYKSKTAYDMLWSMVCCGFRDGVVWVGVNESGGCHLL